MKPQLYQKSLVLLDEESVARIKRFYRRADACRTLLGRLLPRMALSHLGIPLDRMHFSKTETGKPYIVCSRVLSIVWL